MRKMTTETLLNDRLVNWVVTFKTMDLISGDKWIENTYKKIGGNLECTTHHCYSENEGAYIFGIRYRTTKEKMELICKKHSLRIDQIVKGFYFLAND